MTEDEEKPYSRLRNFLVPDAINTLRSAAFRHSRKDFDGADMLFELTEWKIKECRRQLQQDKEESHQNGGEGNGS